MPVTPTPRANAVAALTACSHHDPFALLGRHREGVETRVTAYRPDASELFIRTTTGLTPMQREGNSGLFFWQGQTSLLPAHTDITRVHPDGSRHSYLDPYDFPPDISAPELRRFSHETCYTTHALLGAHPRLRDGIAGVRFSVWAPNAERVSVVGDFNQWDGRIHVMQSRGESGIWELFIPAVAAGSCYKYEIRNRSSGEVFLKADPYGRQFELRPRTASVVTDDTAFGWSDQIWMTQRCHRSLLHEPLSIYEVHLGSWQRPGNEFPGYRKLAMPLVDYVKGLGFTHIQLMPVTEHPFDGSWGYQVTGYFAPTRRYGEPDDLRFFIDYCHRHKIGVLLDWVPAHFPKDPHSLGRFDGSFLYEHEDPLRAEHRDWGTLVFNYGRHEVKNFLLSSAYYWLSEFHFDGLRIDAVASMLYLDYSRQAEDWLPNQFGGNENLEAIAFLREANSMLHGHFPGALVIAEESTAFPMVSRPVYLGGLGFTMKWNMGWMNDTLAYMALDPVYRQYNQNRLTFGLLYAFTENFILPLSHDEVVHGKGSLLGKMPGDRWQRFANLRALYFLQFTHPGAKLLFMGAEIAQDSEWDHDSELHWGLLQQPEHQGVQRLVGDLNRLYTSLPPLHKYDFEQKGFRWLDCNDHANSVLSFIRQADAEFVVVVINLTPVPRCNYRIPVPLPGLYRVILNSDSSAYAGSNYQDPVRANDREASAQQQPYLGFPCSLSLTLPPLAGLILQRCDDAD